MKSRWEKWRGQFFIVAVHIRNNELFSFERQGKLGAPSFLSSDIARKALELFRQNYRWEKPIRSIGVRGADLVTATGLVQLEGQAARFFPRIRHLTQAGNCYSKIAHGF